MVSIPLCIDIINNNIIYTVRHTCLMEVKILFVKIEVSAALHKFCLGILIYVDGFGLTGIYQFDGFHPIVHRHHK
jgi:hypothetical protein